MNFKSLCVFVDSHQNIDSITLSETHLSRDENTDLYKINGYDLILRCSENGNVGGNVAVYIRTQLTWERRERID